MQTQDCYQGCLHISSPDVCVCRRKKDLADKYCRRQAEDGVGDCSGLRLIPGMTKSGKQETPEFIKKMLNIPEVAAE